MIPLRPALLLAAAAALPATVAAQETTRISVDSGGAQGNGYSYSQGMSADGRYVVFNSGSTNLVAGDTNGVDDVFVYDRRTGAVERVSVTSAGVQGNSTNTWGAMSADGRWVAFYAKSDNLVPGDTNGVSDVFVHDRALGTTVRASVGAAGVQANGGSYACSISADGRYVAFESDATNLVPGDTNAALDIFVKDLVGGQVTRVSVATGGGQSSSGSRQPSISADGTRVAFASDASNLVVPDLNPGSDVYLHDLPSGTTVLVHVDSAGNQGLPGSTAAGGADQPSISADGMRVSFASGSPNLVANDLNGTTDVFVHDLASGQTVRVSVSSAGVEANDTSRGSRISDSGRQVLFESRAGNLVAGDTNFQSDVFVHDLDSGVTERVSVGTAGQQATDTCYLGDLSLDGRYASFHTASSAIVPLDTNGTTDVFLRDRGASPGDILLDGGGVVPVGGTVTLEWSGAPTTGTGWLAWSGALTGVVVQGHVFDLGQPVTVAAAGPATASGAGSWTSPPIPAGAAGKTVWFEFAAREPGGIWHDSNAVMTVIW